MEILGVGPLEFVLIVIILLLVLGPEELATLGKRAGKLIRTVRNSETWILLANLARTFRNLPNTLADEVGMDEIMDEVVPGRGRRTIAPERPNRRSPTAPGDQARADGFSAWTTPAAPIVDAPEQQPGPDDDIPAAPEAADPEPEPDPEI